MFPSINNQIQDPCQLYLHHATISVAFAISRSKSWNASDIVSFASIVFFSMRSCIAPNLGIEQTLHPLPQCIRCNILIPTPRKSGEDILLFVLTVDVSITWKQQVRWLEYMQLNHLSGQLTLSHAFASSAFLSLAKKLDCPPARNAMRTWASSSSRRFPSDTVDWVDIDGDRDRGKSAPHISHCIMLGWFRNVHTLQANPSSFSAMLSLLDEVSVGSTLLSLLFWFVRLTPHKLHTSWLPWLENEQIAHTQVEVTGEFAEDRVFCRAGGSAK